mmetsp:Transcript_106059/g.204118  ORF Transcript_106059/g.204118 Transcript_106059/m.204118 type:complete len:226 (+) Transcript_106059:47-724(+)
MDENEEESASDPKSSGRSALSIFAILLVCWLALGFLHAGHWIAICCILKGTRSSRIAAAHMASCWIGILLTAIGGGWCRSGGGQSAHCPGGEEMSRDCLWQEQGAVYQTIYTMHYVGLAWSFAHWVLDAFHLASWSRQLAAGEELTVFWSSFKLDNFRYAAVVAAATSIVTLTWTRFFNWSTADGFNILAAVLLVEMLVVGSSAALILRICGIPGLCDCPREIRL